MILLLGAHLTSFPQVAGVFVVFGSMIFLTLPMTVIVSKFNEVSRLAEN